MFIQNLPNDFYNVILGHRTLLLVNFDVDAICACKILQYLFKNDNMIYTLVPVQGVQDLVQAYTENCEEVSYVIMINCGGTLDIVELLQPSEDIIFFIADSHRPYDLCNIYSEDQVRILGKPDAEEDIPEYNDVFRDDSSDEEEPDDGDDSEAEGEGEDRRVKRRRLNEEDIIRRRQRVEWSKNRSDILFQYTQYSYYGKSSAVLIFELAWKMSKDSLDMVWCGIVGATEQAILGKVETSASVLEAGSLQAHVSRLSHRHVTDENQSQQSTVKVIYEKDLQLPLYRHWTVEASLKHSIVTAVSLRLWSAKGEKRIKELLAEMGLPLAQSRQKFCTMDLNLRQEFKQMLEKLASKYNLDSIVGGSFMLQYGYRFKYCASDVVYAMLALLESSTKERLPQRCFLDALDCLSRLKKDSLEHGIDTAKHMLENIFRTGHTVLEMKKIKNTGSFLYVVLSESDPNGHLFTHPHSLILFAQFTLRAYVESTKSRRARGWPLIACASINSDEDSCLLVGIPPISEDQPRSLFGRAFEQAARNTNSFIDPDYFDATIIRLKIKEQGKFFDALTDLFA
ncbi:cell division control protein 45 homolog [Cephus cinctus]|uniref:Cell division control protein 45 homolog n=1 Tax=Cephus cinctus TaxID=211228 RepID=A0AAJ7RLW9_CEPCN|nr:cell division control protein 45 homolog [Cephus cinctus]